MQNVIFFFWCSLIILLQLCSHSWVFLAQTKKNKKMSFDHIENFHSMKFFDDFLKIWSYYHVGRCQHEDYLQCLFASNLRCLYVQKTVQQINSVEPFKSYCRVRKEQFNCARLFIRTLLRIQKTTTWCWKKFHEPLTPWNKPS